MKEENFAYAYVPDEDKGLIFMVRDRESKNEERWVVSYLNKKQQKNLYEYLKNILSK